MVDPYRSTLIGCLCGSDGVISKPRSTHPITITTTCLQQGKREGGREGGERAGGGRNGGEREGGRDGGESERGRIGMEERGREEWRREGGRDGGRDGGREGGRDGGERRGGRDGGERERGGREGWRREGGREGAAPPGLDDRRGYLHAKHSTRHYEQCNSHYHMLVHRTPQEHLLQCYWACRDVEREGERREER